MNRIALAGSIGAPRSPPTHSRVYLPLRRVSPKDGTCVYLIMPTSNTACFQIFLELLARRFPRQHLSGLTVAQPSLRPPRGSRKHHAFVPSALFAGIEPEGKSVGRNPRKVFRTMPSNPWDAVCAK